MLLSMALLAGCQGGGAEKGINCFPADAGRWIYRITKESPAKTGQTAASKSHDATIYVDRSASMVGYVKGENAFERPFHDLVHSLPATLGELDAAASFRAFGTDLSEPLAGGGAAFDRLDFFACHKKGDPGCESHLDQVFQRIAETPAEMAIVVTDLWFDNSEVQTSGVTDLKPALIRILESGRAVAVYGIDAPFQGRIYDFPASASTKESFDHQGRHPLFMIAVGTKSQVLELGRQLARSGSRFIAEGVSSGQIHRSLFMVDPGPEHPQDKTPLDRGDPGGVLAQETFETFGKATIQQFVMRAAAPPRPGATAHANPSWLAPARDAFVENAVWEGRLSPQARIWRREGERCAAAAWIPMGSLEGGWMPAGPQGGADQAKSPGQMRFTLDPAKLLARTRQKGVYLISGELARTSVNSPNVANQWMRDWSFTPEGAAGVAARHPTSFPTLNLSEIARIMEGSLATAAERKGGGITGFTILVKVER